MSDGTASTAPKPFVFVLMPFKQEFNDIYKFGIKGAAEDVGAYSERVDDQDYTESILDRIYNQINKADVIVADMTGQNANVFYEVGYAHALDKIVLLLTQDSNDIPFDLKHRPHIVYGGQIDTLRNKLAQKLKWAINESRNRTKPGSLQPFALMVEGTFIPEASTLEDAPVVELFVTKKDLEGLRLKILIQNVSPEPSYGISHIYLLTSDESPVTPLYHQRIEGLAGRRTGFLSPLKPVKALPITEKSILPTRYRLEMQFLPIPSDAYEEGIIPFRFAIRDVAELDRILGELRTNAPQQEESLVLRIHTNDSVQDFPFKLKVTVLLVTPA
jgi:hypothetical protein